MKKYLIIRAFIIMALGFATFARAQDHKAGYKVLRAYDHETTLKNFKLYAERGHAGAQAILAVKYYYGVGVPHNYCEAVKWARKSAAQGDYSAQYILGHAYVNGNCVKRNSKEALKWFRKAADQGDAESQYQLGKMYDEGLLIVQDRAEALKWMQKAANQQHQDAHNWLISNGLVSAEPRSLTMREFNELFWETVMPRVMAKGTWEGTVTQPGFGSYPLFMVIDSLKEGTKAGTIKYPTLTCGGTLTLIEIKDNNKYVIKEKIVYGRNRRIDGGRIEFRINQKGKLDWKWFYPDGKEGAFATLTRKNN